MHRNVSTRRQWLHDSARLGLGAAAGAAGLVGNLGGLVGPQPNEARAADGGAPASTSAAEPVALGSRRELFVDDFLIARREGVDLRLHRPEPREVVLVCDAPWEGNTSAYYTLFQDGDLYRAYYRGSHFDEQAKKALRPEVTCYAESRDGRTWEKPRLGLHEFAGSKANNIVWAGEGAHNFTPFLDVNPACPPEARYKALAGGLTQVNGKPKHCLYALRSADGLRWARASEEPAITAGAFDSQNLAFFDAARGVYRAYWRYFTSGRTDETGWKPSGHRAIRTAASRDFIHWDEPADLRYVDSPDEHLYTNCVRAYDRAPHLLLGFPTRYQPKTQQVEPVFMSSRDGVLFRRWDEALIPITAPEDRDGNRSNYMTNALLQLPGDEGRLSVFATEAYYTGPGSRVRRFTYRTDGFVSASAGAVGGVLLTRPLTFTGRRLVLNLASRGPTRVELQDPAGAPLAGFSADDCAALRGDAIAREVAWRGGGDLSALVGRPVRVKFLLADADLYALEFAA